MFTDGNLLGQFDGPASDGQKISIAGFEINFGQKPFDSKILAQSNHYFRR